MSANLQIVGCNKDARRQTRERGRWQWLQLRNYLSDIQIADLIVTDATEIGHELTALVERHPIESLSAPNANAADDIAAALAHKSSLRMV